MTEDSTLGGYLRIHERAPAFEGSDGHAYSVALYVDESPDRDGRYGGALLFVRWSASGDQPVGHLETDHLCYGTTPQQAEEGLRSLSLHEVKNQLDLSVLRASKIPSW